MRRLSNVLISASSGEDLVKRTVLLCRKFVSANYSKILRKLEDGWLVIMEGKKVEVV